MSSPGSRTYYKFVGQRTETEDLEAYKLHRHATGTSGKRAFGLDPLVPAAIWAGTKGPATSPQNRLAAREALVPARNEPLVPV
jgi:hypothetical protein